MPYTNDLATLSDVISPVDAAMEQGQQSGYQGLQSAVQNNIAQATMPQEIQKATLANQLLNAQGYAEQGLGMQNQAKGLADLYAAPSTAQATVAGNQAKLTSSHVEQIGQLGQIVGGLADQMQSVPGPARRAMMNQILDSFGVQDPSIRQIMASGDPDQLRQISQGLFQASNAARQTVLGEGIRQQTALGVAGIGANARQQVAETTAQGRIAVEQLRDQQRQQAENFEQAASQELRAHGNTPLYQELSKQALQMRQFVGQTNRALLGMGDMSGYGNVGGANPPAPEAAQGAPQPSTNAPPVGGTQVVNGMEYRQMPDGSWQSRKVQ